MRFEIPNRLPFVLLLFCALAIPAAIHAQGAPQKPEPRGKVAEIRATGSKRYSQDAIAAASGLKVGDVVGRAELQAAADRLADLGPLANVRYKFTSKDDILSVEFQLDDAPTIPCWFDNFPWFTDEELTAGMKSAVALFDGTAPQQGAILDAMGDALAQMLATRGVKASVSHTAVAAPGSDQMILEFRVEGPSLTVNAVQFGDAIARDSLHLQSLLSEIVGKPYSRFSIAVFVSEQVVPLYLQQGYLRVQVGAPQARFTGDPNKPLPDNVLVIVPIDPGPVYQWGGIEWAGDASASVSILDPLIPFKRGDPLNGQEVIALWHRVEDEYARHGFLEAKVEPHAVFDDAARRISYRVSVTAGFQYHMGDLILTGLSLSAEKKLIAAWTLGKGQIFDRMYFDEFLATGIKKVFADDPVHYEKVGHLLQTHPETRTVDVLLDFQ